MTAMIEHGEGAGYWNYHHFDSGAYEAGLTAHKEQLKKYAAIGFTQGEHGFFAWDESDDWHKIPEGAVIKLQAGNNTSLKGWTKLPQGGWGVGVKDIDVAASESYTEVKLTPEVVAALQIVTSGNVTKNELQMPPTIVYKLAGPESVLEIQHTGVGMLKITNQPEVQAPKVIVI